MVVFGIRLIPFRPPNVEPILATQMPFAKRYGWQGGFLFGFCSIFFFDLATSGIGSWTWITAVAYGLLGPLSFLLLKNKQNRPLAYATVGVIGTLAYDAVTGLSIGPLFYSQPFMEALVGQIPFTLMHESKHPLLGGCFGSRDGRFRPWWTRPESNRHLLMSSQLRLPLPPRAQQTREQKIKDPIIMRGGLLFDISVRR